jgi:hypothetical protein
MLWKRRFCLSRPLKSLRISPESDTSRYVNLQVVDSKGNEGIVGINHANHARPSQGEAWHKRPPAGGGGLGPSSASQSVWVLPQRAPARVPRRKLIRSSGGRGTGKLNRAKRTDVASAARGGEGGGLPLPWKFHRAGVAPGCGCRRLAGILGWG